MYRPQQAEPYTILSLRNEFKGYFTLIPLLATGLCFPDSISAASL